MLDAAYWTVIAEGIDVEDKKMNLFVRHNHSRGIAREAILRSLLVAQTPKPFVVSTGFVHDIGSRPPKQCDVLVYDPSVSQPYYRLDEFVVVPPKAAKVAVEVKSDLNLEEFRKLMAMRRQSSKPVLGFAFEGWPFKRFCKELAAEVRQDLRKVPECIVVHRKNYVGIRAMGWSPSTKNEAYLAIDFASRTPGQATSILLDAYMKLLNENKIHDGSLHQWFNELSGLPVNARVVILPDGKTTSGPAMG